MEVKTVIRLILSIIALAGVVSFYLRDDLDMLRNFILIAGTPVAIVLAVWRSSIAQRQSEAAQKQVEIAQGGLLSNRYQRAIEMLGNDLLSVRVGGVRALKNLALEHYDEYQEEVLELLGAYYSSRDNVDMASIAGRHGIMGMSPAETQEVLIKEREEQLEAEERQKAIDAIKKHGERIKSE